MIPLTGSPLLLEAPRSADIGNRSRDPHVLGQCLFALQLLGICSPIAVYAVYLSLRQVFSSQSQTRFWVLLSTTSLFNLLSTFLWNIILIFMLLRVSQVAYELTLVAAMCYAMANAGLGFLRVQRLQTLQSTRSQHSGGSRGKVSNMVGRRPIAECPDASEKATSKASGRNATTGVIMPSADTHWIRSCLPRKSKKAESHLGLRSSLHRTGCLPRALSRRGTACFAAWKYLLIVMYIIEFLFLAIPRAAKCPAWMRSARYAPLILAMQLNAAADMAFLHFVALNSQYLRRESRYLLWRFILMAQTFLTQAIVVIMILAYAVPGILALVPRYLAVAYPAMSLPIYLLVNEPAILAVESWQRREARRSRRQRRRGSMVTSSSRNPRYAVEQVGLRGRDSECRQIATAPRDAARKREGILAGPCGELGLRPKHSNRSPTLSPPSQSSSLEGSYQPTVPPRTSNASASFGQDMVPPPPTHNHTIYHGNHQAVTVEMAIGPARLKTSVRQSLSLGARGGSYASLSPALGLASRFPR